MYGSGISKTGELLDLGVKAGIVEKSGSWFSFESERIGQGRENAKAYLKERPEIGTRIERAIRQNAGLIAGQMLEADAGGETPETDEAGGGASATGTDDATVAPLAARAEARRGRRGA
jgi:recombination protein RecA